MRPIAVLVIPLLLGCSLVQDFDRYSENRDDGTVGVPDSDVGPGGDAGDGGGCGGYDVSSDRDHCGPTCVVCAGASRCVAGSCECAPGATRCAGVCTYLDTDPLNCKTCGVAVADSSLTCSAGNAVCAGALRACKPWSFDFGGSTYDVTCPSNAACVDTGNDGNHCYKYSGTSVTSRVRCYSSTQVGVCVGNVCTYHASSAASACAGAGRIECAVNTEPSDPNVRSCVDTLRDPNHCGGCNAKCSGKDELCADGSCKRYRPARAAEDCGAGFGYCTPSGWTSAVCIEGVSTCPG